MNRLYNYDDDDSLFSQSASSNLASLFGANPQTSQDSNNSLIYTAPKQPKVKQIETSVSHTKTNNQSSVICSRFVDAFKIIEKTPTSEGKCGIALIGNQSLKLYEIILYKSKQEIITRAKLKTEFTFTIKTNNFADFSDDLNFYWSVHFSNLQEISEFAEKIQSHGATIIYNESKNPNESSPVKSPEPKAIGENVSSDKKALSLDEKDSDSFSDTSKTKANILSRMAKMGQSILPANTAQKTYEQSESESEIEVANKKLMKKRTTTQDKPKNTRTVSTNNQPVVQNIPEYTVINGQVIPISMLPQNSNILNNQFIPNAVSIPNPILWNQQPQIPTLNDPLNIFVAESRTHNCEMRMNMSGVSLKLDQILSKLDANITNVYQNNKDSSEKELEDTLLVNCTLKNQIETLEKQSDRNKCERDNLVQENENKNKTISEQKELIKQLKQEKEKLLQEVAEGKNLETTMKCLQLTIEEQKTELEKLQQFYDANKDKSNENKNDTQCTDKILKLEAELNDYRMKTDNFAGNLKETMNSLYQQIMENFASDDESFESASIRIILSQKLKSATLKLIKEFKSDFSGNDK